MLYKDDGTAFVLQGPNQLLKDTDLSNKSFDSVSIENQNSLGAVTVDKISKKAFNTVQELFENEAKKMEIVQKEEAEKSTGQALYKILEPADTKELEREYEKMLKNPDGTPYLLDSKEVSIYNPSGPDVQLIQSAFNEHLNRSGAPVEYYKIIIDANIDDLYLEQRQRVLLQNPITLKAIYDPQVPNFTFMGGGFGDNGSLILNFSKSEFMEKSGELPRIGSVIRTLDDDTLWEIKNVNTNVQGDRIMWGKYMVAVDCAKYQQTLTDEAPVRQGLSSAVSGMKPITII